MRIDARNLLDRLGRNDFAYKEFEDRFNELELWPILEALLKDPRLQTLDQLESGAGAATETLSVAAEAREQEAPTSLGALFSRYERGTGEPAAKPERRAGQDVRAMLRHLSELGSRGEI